MKLGTDQNKYDKSGIYQLTCPDSKKKYTGQTGIPFKIRIQVWEEQIEICPVPPRKHTCSRPNGRYNGHHPRKQQGQSDGHVRKVSHLEK
jgi:hypothetical protein